MNTGLCSAGVSVGKTLLSLGGCKPFSYGHIVNCFSAFEGMRTADIIRQEIEDLERLLQGNTVRKKALKWRNPLIWLGPNTHIPSFCWMYVKRHDRKRLEPREFPWQQHYVCHFVSFVMCISGAKFEEHCFNISRDILYSEILLF